MLPIQSSTRSIEEKRPIAAVEFHYFMHMRVKTICRFQIRMEKYPDRGTLLAAPNRTVRSTGMGFPRQQISPDKRVAEAHHLH